MVDTLDTKVLYAPPPDKPFKKMYMGTLAILLRAIRPLVFSEVQVHNTDNIKHNGTIMPGPCLWLARHEALPDPLVVGPLWSKHQHRPDMRIPARNFTKWYEKAVRDIFRLKHFIFHVDRTSLGDGATDAEKEAMWEKNLYKLAKVHGNYVRGTHASMFPEGTTENNGMIQRPKRGAYLLSYVTMPDGSRRAITSVPINITYDPLCGRKSLILRRKRELAFVNFGVPFHYQQLDGDPRCEHYQQADREHHLERVYQHMIDANVATTSQIIGEYLIHKNDAHKDAGKLITSVDELARVLDARVDALHAAGIPMDEKLLNPKARGKRFKRFYKNALKQKYLKKQKNGLSVNTMRMRAPQAKKGYKKANPLRFSANRIIQWGEERSTIGDILKSTR